MKRFGFALAICLMLLAGVLRARPGQWVYTSGYKVASGTSAVLTLENPTDSTNEARILSIEVYLENYAGDVTVTRNATSIADGTGLAESKASPYHGDDAVPTAEVTAKSGATVTGGTALPAARPIAAGTALIISYENIELVAGENLAVSVAADSADAITVIVVWEEFPAE